MCEIISYAVPMTDANGRQYAGGPATSQTMCKTHNWYWQRGAAVTAINEMCPLGRIEAATEDALAKIAAAK